MVTILIMVVSETVVSHWVQMCLVYFLLRNADMRSAYLLQRCGWLAGWLGVRHTPVLYQNGKTIPEMVQDRLTVTMEH